MVNARMVLTGSAKPATQTSHLHVQMQHRMNFLVFTMALLALHIARLLLQTVRIFELFAAVEHALVLEGSQHD